MYRTNEYKQYQELVNVKNDIFEQRMYPQREQGYIVGEMSEAKFIRIKKLYHEKFR